jgi:hypothetical protein
MFIGNKFVAIEDKKILSNKHLKLRHILRLYYESFEYTLYTMAMFY